MTEPKPGLRDQGPPLPQIRARSNRLFMEFSENVHKVVVFDTQGKMLQQCTNGRRFDITESLIKTNAGSIYLGIAPDPGSAVFMRLDPRERERYRIDLTRHRQLAQTRIVLEDETTMGSREPANNSIGGAPLHSAGFVEGEVGGADAEDFARVTASGDGTGTLVQVQVAIALYDAYGTHVFTENSTVNARGCILSYDLRPEWEGVTHPPFPSGEWRILVTEAYTTEAGSGAPVAYSLGEPPAAYTRSGGESLSVALPA